MDTVKSSDCRAKDPSTCRFHGAVLRMEKAVATGDLESYMVARDEVDKLKADPRNDFKPSVTASPAKQKEETKSEREFKARKAYLQDTAAVPTPMEAFALWVAVYEKQGGKLKSYDGTYNSFSNVISNDPETKAQQFSYDSLAWSRWTPTKGHVPIPAGFGSARLQLFILPDVIDQPFHKALSEHRGGKPDPRSGWEWGHTAVYILERNAKGELVAITNQRDVTTYKDVEQYRRGKSFADLMGAFRRVQQQSSSLEG